MDESGRHADQPGFLHLRMIHIIGNLGITDDLPGMDGIVLIEIDPCPLRRQQCKQHDADDLRLPVEINRSQNEQQQHEQEIHGIQRTPGAEDG